MALTQGVVYWRNSQSSRFCGSHTGGGILEEQSVLQVLWLSHRGWYTGGTASPPGSVALTQGVVYWRNSQSSRFCGSHTGGGILEEQLVLQVLWLSHRGWYTGGTVSPPGSVALTQGVVYWRNS